MIAASPVTTDEEKYSIRFIEERNARANDEQEVNAHRLFNEASQLQAGSSEALAKAVGLSKRSTSSDSIRAAQANLLFAKFSYLCGNWTEAEGAFARSVEFFRKGRDEAGRLQALRSWV